MVENSLDQFIQVPEPHVSILVVKVLPHCYQDVVRFIALRDFVRVFKEVQQLQICVWVEIIVEILVRKDPVKC